MLPEFFVDWLFVPRPRHYLVDSLCVPDMAERKVNCLTVGCIVLDNGAFDLYLESGISV